jgi:hypothetical protein
MFMKFVQISGSLDWLNHPERMTLFGTIGARRHQPSVRILRQPPSCLLEIKEDSQYIIHIYAPACAQLLIS